MDTTAPAYTFRLSVDEDVESPREYDEGNLATFCLAHKRHNLPNETDLDLDDFGSWDEVEAELRRQGAVLVLPVYGYDHSGLAMSTQVERTWWHYAWDGGQLGLVAVVGEHARQMMGWKRITADRLAWLEQQAKNEIATYCQWSNGDIWYYEVQDAEGETVDSCGGYYGREAAVEAIKELYPDAEELEPVPSFGGWDE